MKICDVKSSAWKLFNDNNQSTLRYKTLKTSCINPFKEQIFKINNFFKQIKCSLQTCDVALAC